MRASAVITVATGLLSTSQAIQLVERNATPNIPRLDIQRKYVADPVAHDIRRRASSKTVQESLDNEVYSTISMVLTDWLIHAVDSLLCKRQPGNACPEASIAYRYRKQ